MRVLCIGDVVGSAGCNYLRQKLPELKRSTKADYVIVNAENSADGNGVLPSSADSLFGSGADVLTGGNHSLKRREIYTYMEDNERILRPANFLGDIPGNGSCVLDLGFASMRVINLAGVTYMEGSENPFFFIDRFLKNCNERFIIIDFHAEATSEKIALANYLDGRISAIYGTHTHVQTADARILPNGTGYITDVGMTGPVNSVIGVNIEAAISRLKSPLPVRFTTAPGGCMLTGAVFDLDDKTGLCVSCEGVSN